VIASWSYI